MYKYVLAVVPVLLLLLDSTSTTSASGQGQWRVDDSTTAQAWVRNYADCTLPRYTLTQVIESDGGVLAESLNTSPFIISLDEEILGGKGTPKTSTHVHSNDGHDSSDNITIAAKLRRTVMSPYDEDVGAWSPSRLIQALGDEYASFGPGQRVVWLQGASRMRARLSYFINTIMPKYGNYSGERSGPAKQAKGDSMGPRARKDKGPRSPMEDEPPYVFSREFFINALGSQFFDDHVNLPFDMEFMGFNSSHEVNTFLLLGPSGSGATFHGHPRGLNVVVHGLKRWFFSPPHLTPAGGVPQTLSVAQWLHAFGDHVQRDPRGSADSSLQSDGSPRVDSATTSGVSTCLQRPTDLVYIPDRWYHSVINVGDTVGIAVQVTSARTEDTLAQAFRDTAATVTALGQAGKKMEEGGMDPRDRALQLGVEIHEGFAVLARALERMVTSHIKLIQLVPGNIEAVFKLADALAHSQIIRNLAFIDVPSLVIHRKQDKITVSLLRKVYTDLRNLVQSQDDEDEDSETVVNIVSRCPLSNVSGNQTACTILTFNEVLSSPLQDLLSLDSKYRGTLFQVTVSLLASVLSHDRYFAAAYLNLAGQLDTAHARDLKSKPGHEAPDITVSHVDMAYEMSLRTSGAEVMTANVYADDYEPPRKHNNNDDDDDDDDDTENVDVSVPDIKLTHANCLFGVRYLEWLVRVNPDVWNPASMQQRRLKRLVKQGVKCARRSYAIDLLQRVADIASSGIVTCRHVPLGPYPASSC